MKRLNSGPSQDQRELLMYRLAQEVRRVSTTGQSESDRYQELGSGYHTYDRSFEIFGSYSYSIGMSCLIMT
jgi:hypothetical protein